MEPIRIQRVVDHIEGHLTQELSGEDLAAMMAVSEADLQRSFKMITGWTMGEYIRCRRLSEAALDLKRGDRVLDAAPGRGTHSRKGAEEGKHTENGRNCRGKSEYFFEKRIAGRKIFL